MRYHWGLAAGHTYAHVRDGISEPESELPVAASTNIMTSAEEPEMTAVNVHMSEEDQNDGDPELGFENRQDDLIDSEDASNDGEGSEREDDELVEDAGNFDSEDDDEFLAMDSMYGSAYD